MSSLPAEAFDAMARRTGDRCKAVAFRILRDVDLADDAVQAALLLAWRDLRCLRDPELFEPWFRKDPYPRLLRRGSASQAPAGRARCALR